MSIFNKIINWYMGGTPEQLANDAIIRKEIDEFLKEKGVKSLWELEN